MGCSVRTETGIPFRSFLVTASAWISSAALCSQLIWYVETVLWRASSSEIRTGVELEPPTLPLDSLSCSYSMHLELPCIKPSVVIHVPKSSKPFALQSLGKNRQNFDSRNCWLYRSNFLTLLDLIRNTFNSYCMYIILRYIHYIRFFTFERWDFPMLTFDSHCSFATRFTLRGWPAALGILCFSYAIQLFHLNL